MSEDINQEILAELRKLKRVLYALLVLIIVCTLPAFFRGFSRGVSQPAPSWRSVDSAMSQQDFPKALAEAQALVLQQPQYSYGEAYLGVIYLAMGDLTNAEIHYLRSYELFPNEDGQKDLAAIRRRLAGQQPIRLLSK
jgi:cytochrome c-type biogenesis protein CcmH/NrfG